MDTAKKCVLYVSSNYDSCDWVAMASMGTPYIVGGFLLGFYDAQKSYQRRFDAIDDDSSSYIDRPMGMSLMDYLGRNALESKGRVFSSHLGMASYVLGGTLRAENRDFFVKDLLTRSIDRTIITSPVSMCKTESTAIPFFYGTEFELQAARTHRAKDKEATAQAAKNPKQTRSSLSLSEPDATDPSSDAWIQDCYFPMLRSYKIVKSPPIPPVESRRYAMNGSFYEISDPFTGKKADAPYTGANITDHCAYYICLLRTECYQWGYQKAGYRKTRESNIISVDDVRLIDTFNIHRTADDEDGATIHLTLPNDVLVLDGGDKARAAAQQKLTALIAKLKEAHTATPNLKIVFMQEWADAKVHSAATKMIRDLTTGVDRFTLENIHYYDVNPKVAISDALYNACSIADAHRVIHTIGMNNPNTDAVQGHHINIPQKELTKAQVLNTVCAMVAAEFAEEFVWFSLTHITNNGLLPTLLNWRGFLHGLQLVPKIMLKTAGFVMKSFVHLGIMAYLYVSGKNKNVFEIPRANSTSVHNKCDHRQRIPKTAKFVRSPVKESVIPSSSSSSSSQPSPPSPRPH